jgi:hypothetical protein
MAKIEAALAVLALYDKPNITAIATKHKVRLTTLSRRAAEFAAVSQQRAIRGSYYIYQLPHRQRIAPYARSCIE